MRCANRTRRRNSIDPVPGIGTHQGTVLNRYHVRKEKRSMAGWHRITGMSHNR